MRKTMTLITATLLALAACGGGSGSDDGDGGKVTITFSDWHLTEPHWEKTLKEAIARFEQEHPNISVDLDYVSYADKETKYATEVQARRGPDVMHLHAYSLRSFIDRRLAADLTPFIEKEDEGFTDQWFPSTTELMKSEDAWYALPGDFMAMVLMYNTALFEQAGLDPDRPPTTWEEFQAAATKLTQDTNGDGQPDTWGFGTVGAIDPGFELRFTPFLFSFGGQYLTDDNSCSALDRAPAKEAFRYYVSLAAEHGAVPPGVTQQNAGNVREQLASGQVAMLLGSGWTVPIVDTLNPELDAAKTLAATPVPVRQGANASAGTTAWLSAWVMNPHSDHPDEAWELMKFITAQQQEQQWFDDARVLSAREDVSGQDGYQPLLDDPFAGVIAAELENADFVPQVTEWPQIAETVNRAAQEAFSGDRSPDDALADAHDQIDQILGC